MLAPDNFFEALKNGGIGLFAGVPDSLLANLCAYIDDHSGPKEHIITANEGNAVALVSGYHLTTGGYGCVYLQNSGLGNTINPITSIADPEVYRIPMLMIIGWRGEPDVKDEPQHIKQGRITPAQLELLEIPYWIVDADSDQDALLKEALETMRTTNAPVALLVRKNTFSPYKTRRQPVIPSTLKREDALRELLALAGDSLIVSTTGKTSREVFELRVEKNQPQRDFLTVGGMGHTASIALGAALGKPDRQVVCIDGDGSVLMHMGALPIIGDVAPGNLVHVLLNNAAHESVGGQPTVGDSTDFGAIARASGYSSYRVADSLEAIRTEWDGIRSVAGPVMLEVRITTGSRDDLGRPTSTPVQNKEAFMQAAKD